MLDIIIKGGTIVDGIGEHGFIGDVGIQGDKIVEIGNLDAASGAVVIDAAGQIVSPGFIDMHTHSDMSLMYDNKASSRIYDGVTTEVIGNCGIGVAPICDERKEELSKYLSTRLIGSIPVELKLPWNTMEEYFTALMDHHPATNIIPLLSQGTIRINEMGFSKDTPTAEQMAHMKAEITKAMQAGCFGFTTGLMYMPGEYCGVEDLGELCTAVAPFGGDYISHIRDEGITTEASLDEAIAIAKKGGVGLHVCHLKLCGVTMWGKTDELFAQLDRAKAEGVPVTFDVYPYTRGCTSLGSCIPPWAFEGGTDNMLQRVADPDIRIRLVDEIQKGIPGWYNPIKTIGAWDKITIATAATDNGRELIGKTIAEISENQHKSPYDVVFDTLLQEKGRVQILEDMMAQEDVDTIVCHPDSMVCSDSMALSTEGILSAGNPHPRAFGSRGRLFSYYVREKNMLTVEEAVKKVTSKPADWLKLDRRGTIQTGNFADITVFNKDTIQDMATYARPKQYTKGIQTVIVNGKIALRDGVQTTNTNGYLLRKQ